jgi:hypothetical protein
MHAVPEAPTPNATEQRQRGAFGPAGFEVAAASTARQGAVTSEEMSDEQLRTEQSSGSGTTRESARCNGIDAAAVRRMQNE